MDKQDKELLNEERSKILLQWDQWFEIPLIILGFCWLFLLILELTKGLSPFLETLSFTIWIIFIADFIIRFSLAPFKINFLKSNGLTIIALIIPAFRVFKGLQLIKAARGLYLAKIATSMRRGMHLMSSVFKSHGFGYIMGLTLIVILLGAAGIQAFEGGFKNYGDALWWTAMIITTMGTDFWPQTPEGRVLCLGLAIYAFAIFGYITATVASFLIEKDKENKGENKKILEAIEELKQKIEKLKIE